MHGGSNILAAWIVCLANYGGCVRPRQYLSWYSWLGRKRFSLMLVVQLTAAAFTAVACIAGSHLAGWRTTSGMHGWPLPGFGAGLIGAAVVRADVRPSRGGAGTGGSIVHLFTQFLVGITEAVAELRSETWARNLPRDELVEVVASAPVAKRIAAQRLPELRHYVRDLWSRSEATKRWARGALATYVAETYVRADKPKPKVNVPSATAPQP